jgi:hypothetical protein
MRAFLILDEADSLLRDRAAARHSWEITQVNELLTWMERHPYPELSKRERLWSNYASPWPGV